jgi:malonate decarboxylase delta subunit
MQTLNYSFPATMAVGRRVHIGVVGSGDLEILVEPPSGGMPADTASVRVRTSVDGFDTTWHDVLERFFHKVALNGRWELNDFGATPGVVTLRLQQAAEAGTADMDTEAAKSGDPS